MKDFAWSGGSGRRVDSRNKWEKRSFDVGELERESKSDVGRVESGSEDDGEEVRDLCKLKLKQMVWRINLSIPIK